MSHRRSRTRLLAAAFLSIACAVSTGATTAAEPPPAKTWPARDGVYTIRDFRFGTGDVLPELRLHYVTLGTPHRDAQGRVDNAVLLLHGTGGDARSLLNPLFADVLFGPGQPLDITKYFVVLPDDIGHGQSSKPSDGLRMKFPRYDYDDMVRSQRQMLVDGLQIDRLRLILGTSMGCMQSFVWGTTYPGFADALMPLACLPTAIAGRNRMMRHLAIEAIKQDPAWRSGDYTQQPASGLRSAAMVLFTMGSSPLQLQKAAPTRELAEKYVDDYVARSIARTDANDLIYQFDASRNYDPSGALSKITVPVRFVNSADDYVNPPELGFAEQLVKRMPRAKFVLLPTSPETRGHGTHTHAALWKDQLVDLLRESATGESGAATVPGGAAPHGDPTPARPAAKARWDDASMWVYPNTRWAFSHIRDLLPTAGIRRGPGRSSALPRAERADLDAVTFTTPDGHTTTWRESLDAHRTDGILVLHRGRIVYERYLGELAADDAHISASVTKSFVGTLAESLIAEGRLDPTKSVASYVPELANSGFGDATVRQVMDMRTGVAFSEDYAGLGTAPSDVTRLMLASAFVPTPPGYVGPDGLYAFVATIGKSGAHGGDFVYRSPNTLVLGWVLERVTGLPLARQIEQRFWSTMGMEQDAYLAVDRLGTGYGAGGLGTSLRDLARFGEMIRLGGRWNGRQIIPPAAAAAIFAPGDAAAFAAAKYPSLDGGSYASQWWHRASGQLLALGIYGQGIYVDRKAELVIVRYASHPVASNRSLLPTTLASYDAIAAAVTGRRASAPPPR